MKFIPLLFVLGCIAANSQITTTGGAKVFVSPETLLFSTGDITVESGTGLVTNKGNIKISQGTLKNNATSEKFIITYDNEAQYGQLIIESKKKPTGTITVQKQLNDAGPYVYFGSPFTGYSYDEFTQTVTNNSSATSPEIVCGLFGVNNNCKNNPYRWDRHPIFVWRDDRYRNDPYQGGGEPFTPGKYYTVRKKNFTDIGANFANTLSFTGTPYVAGTKPADGGTASSADLTLAYADRIRNGYNIGNSAKNGYGILYYTYLNDPFATEISTYAANTSDTDLNSARFADRMLHLVNPYTSNLDLKALTNNYANVIGVGSEGVVSSDASQKIRYEGNIQSATHAGLAGDDLRYIPPMTNFFIKVNSDNLSLDLYKESSAQTFEMGDYKFIPPPSALSSRSSRSMADVYQANLILSSGETIYGNTYVAASEDLVTGAINSAEARNNNNISEYTSIYTIPEAETGGIAPGFEDAKLYINVINLDAAKVAIPVGVNILDEDKGKEFTFTSDLKFNQTPLENQKTNFDNPDAKFYFHDKETSKVREIDSNFSYSVVLSESTNNRFEIFWKESGTMANEDINTLNGLTTVYKTGNEYKVRFDKNWQKAEVNVFSILGQLISSEKNISTQNDYLLPIYNSSSSMYVVVVINSVTGEKITKKIVK